MYPRVFHYLVCAASLVAAQSALAQAFDQYSGQETYMRFCAACHGEDAKGNGPVAAGLPITVPDLTVLQKRRGDQFPEEVVRRIIDGQDIVVLHGTRYMPVWGYEFWVEEGADDEAVERVVTIVDNLVDYLRSVQE
ncbi:MAG: cytochrome c [Gammaproteobacteria bacterium]|nr:cytochrome c [Gammaproteobacteria bacterium]NND54338.1 cytochrome c [Gammaproteobacteria bacterium]